MWRSCFSDASGVHVFGLAAAVTVTGTEVALDTITVRGGAGDDVIEASSVQAGAAKLVLDRRGRATTCIISSGGDDVLIGGAGDDVLIGGAGNDVLMAAPATTS